MAAASSLKIKWLVFLAVDALLAVALVWLFMLRHERTETTALRELGVSVYPQPNPLSPFTLRQQNSQSFTREDLMGRWTLVFFGFTNCPDVCPLTMRELDQFYRQLEEAEAVEAPLVVMVTVDPERDTPAQLREYLRSFHPNFIGLTGDPEDLQGLASELYVVSASAAPHNEHSANPAGEEQAGLNHSGHISILNPRAELVGVIRLPHRGENIDTAWRHFAEL